MDVLLAVFIIERVLSAALQFEIAVKRSEVLQQHYAVIFVRSVDFNQISVAINCSLTNLTFVGSL